MINLEQHNDTTALVARLFMSLLFVLYGYFKLTGFAGTVAYMGRLGLPAPTIFAALSVIIELGGGLLVCSDIRRVLSRSAAPSMC
jgi:putative oxidoreductase